MTIAILSNDKFVIIGTITSVAIAIGSSFIPFPMKKLRSENTKLDEAYRKGTSFDEAFESLGLASE